MCSSYSSGVWDRFEGSYLPMFFFQKKPSASRVIRWLHDYMEFENAPPQPSRWQRFQHFRTVKYMLGVFNQQQKVTNKISISSAKFTLFSFVSIIPIFTPPKTNMTISKQPGMKMYPLLKILVTFPIDMLVFRGYTVHPFFCSWKPQGSNELGSLDVLDTGSRIPSARRWVVKCFFADVQKSYPGP